MLYSREADEIWMVVSPQNPFKQSSDLLPEADRYRLVRRALDGHEQIKPCDFEFDLPKPSYTVDTMRAMREKHAEHDFFLIMGSDNILGIKGWKDYEELLTAHPIAVYPRPGYEVDTYFINRLPGEITRTDSPLLDISSTLIRTSITEGRPCRFLMREAVWRAVEREGYYSI
ncbi:UNVERIFIED_CONTAM: hypothetical protein GTU68_015727 [Idotea baltica]|nr:hypothetical protein [Idotea baltica]